ncbi:YraN family protein [Marinospirillum sp.]|uniref:YraN family protein n=1 Tax=Marinospirillum sp. TaxID=2183934 RepID=UPI003A85EC8F
MPSPPPHLRNGQKAEEYALHYLLQQGLRCRTRNFRSRYGEIDLIMQQQETIVFVEVRYRVSARFGGGIGSITPQKIRRCRATAEVYLRRYTHLPPCRFDVISINGNLEQATALTWIQDAF